MGAGRLVLLTDTDGLQNTAPMLEEVEGFLGNTILNVIGLGSDADIDGPLLDYKEKGHKAELVGHDSVEGTDCYKIKLSMKNGDVRYYYLDTDSFLELKLEIQTTIRGALQESEVYYGDYEKVNGVYYPFSVEQAPKGSSSRAQISVEKVEQNVPMDDAHFSVPVSKPEAKASPAGS